jgi:hypothetical protein
LRFKAFFGIFSKFWGTSNDYYLQPPNEKLNENEMLVLHVVGFGAHGAGAEYPPVLHDGGGGV